MAARYWEKAGAQYACGGLTVFSVSLRNKQFEQGSRGCLLDRCPGTLLPFH